MIIKRRRNDGPELAISTSTHLGSIAKSIDDSFQRNFKRVLYPESSFREEEKNADYMVSLLKYILNIPEKLVNAPVLSESQVISEGDLVAIKKSDISANLGIVSSRKGNHYNVYPMPLNRFQAVLIDQKYIVKLDHVNYKSEEIDIGSRVSFNQIEKLSSNSAREGLKVTEQIHKGHQENFIFYYAEKFVIGYKAYNDRSRFGPTEKFILCSPVKMTNIETYHPVEYSNDIVTKTFEDSGLLNLVKGAIEDHNVAVKRLNRTVLSQKEIATLSDVYIEYFC